MKILATSRDMPAADWSGRDSLLREEAAHVWALYAAGVIRDISFTVPERNAVIILECESCEAAEHILGAFPLVRERLIEFSLIRLVPYDGFARLFAAGPIHAVSGEPSCALRSADPA